MQLSWLQYQSGTASKYYLVLVLLDLEDKFVTLLAKDIDNTEIERIRKDMTTIDELSIEDKIKWFKQNISSYNKAYREFKKSQSKVEGVFSLSKL